MADKPTLAVTGRGEIASGTPRLGYRRGFAELLDFTSPPDNVVILSADGPTAIGFMRTGSALRDALAAFRKAKP